MTRLSQVPKRLDIKLEPFENCGVYSSVLWWKPIRLELVRFMHALPRASSDFKDCRTSKPCISVAALTSWRSTTPSIVEWPNVCVAQLEPDGPSRKRFLSIASSSSAHVSEPHNHFSSYQTCVAQCLTFVNSSPSLIPRLR